MFTPSQTLDAFSSQINDFTEWSAKVASAQVKMTGNTNGVADITLPEVQKGGVASWWAAKTDGEQEHLKNLYKRDTPSEIALAIRDTEHFEDIGAGEVKAAAAAEAWDSAHAESIDELNPLGDLAEGALDPTYDAHAHVTGV